MASIRGGLVPEATPDGEYFEKFQLDYGCEDNVRLAGRMMGLLKPGKISSLPEKDPLFSWLNEKLERGPQVPTTRFKPYYAADFGTKADLKRGENPKIIIVNRKLAAAADGTILPAPTGPVDLEVREVWQPWLKRRCNFVVRYIVPNRANIMELMENQGRFRAEMHIGRDSNGARTATAHVVFKPTLWERLQGKKDVVMKRALDATKLFEAASTAKDS
eukprot:gene15119-17319_t